MTIKKKIWIINQYGTLPSTGIGGRHRHFARELSKLGHKVTYISSSLHHYTTNKSKALNSKESEKFEGFTFLKVPSIKYKHAHDKRRVLNWFYFALKLFSIGKKIKYEPDAIIYSSPSLIGFISAYVLAKKYNTKLIFDVRDIWPLTLIELGGYSPYNPFIVFLQLIEDFAYSKSDHIISNLKGLKIHINKRIKSKYKFTWIPNGFSFIDTNFKDLANKKLLSAIKRQVFSITYTGTIGEANSLDTLLEAAALIKNKKNIHINIIGTGRLAKTLKTKTKNLNLSNIHFWGNVSKTKIQSILKVSDACVRCAKRSGIHKYGNAANKIYEYLISGRPVINAYSGNYDIVKEFGAGITIPSENSLLLSKAIIKLYLMSKVKRRKMGDEGRRAAKNYLEYTSITKKLNKVISS